MGVDGDGGGVAGEEGVVVMSIYAREEGWLQSEEEGGGGGEGHTCQGKKELIAKGPN